MAKFVYIPDAKVWVNPEHVVSVYTTKWNGHTYTVIRTVNGSVYRTNRAESEVVEWLNSN